MIPQSLLPSLYPERSLVRARDDESRSIENPAVPLTDLTLEDAERYGLVGGASASGFAVNERTAQTIAAVYGAVRLLSFAVAKIGLHVYRRLEEGAERAKGHPAERMLYRRANAQMSAFQAKLWAIPRVLLNGNAYFGIVWGSDLRPREMIPIAPDRMTVEQTSGGLLRYFLRTRDGGRREIPHGSLLHFRGPGDELVGYSVLQLARDSIGEAIGAQRYAGRFFRNGVRPSAVLEHPKLLKGLAKQNLKESWRAFMGAENAHQLVVMEEGATLKPFSISMKDAEFLETRQFKVRDIANWFGVPPHLLGDASRTGYASLEQENQSLLDNGIDPLLGLWEAECNFKLFDFEDGDEEEHYCEFQRNAFVRANFLDRMKGHQLSILSGWRSRDEVRGTENMNPMPEGKGKVFLEPMNMKEAGEEDEPAPAATKPRAPNVTPPVQQKQRARERIFEQTIARVARRMARQLSRAITAERREEWCEEQRGEEASTALADELSPTLEVLGIEDRAADVASRLRELFVRAATRDAADYAAESAAPILREIFL